MLVWDLSNNQQNIFCRHEDEVWGVAYRSDGKYLASAGEDGLMILWDVATAKEVRRFRAHGDTIHGMTFSRDGQRLATASRDGTVKIWSEWVGGHAGLPPRRSGMSLLHLAHGLERCFRLHPDTADVPGLFRRADAVVLPSFYEGLPNSVREAMSGGRPALASRVSDAGNLIADGDNGFLFDPYSPADMAAAIVKMATLSVPEREAMGARGRRRAEELFCPESVLAKYTEVLEAAAQRRQDRIERGIGTVPSTADNALAY